MRYFPASQEAPFVVGSAHGAHRSQTGFHVRNMVLSQPQNRASFSSIGTHRNEIEQVSFCSVQVRKTTNIDSHSFCFRKGHLVFGRPRGQVRAAELSRRELRFGRSRLCANRVRRQLGQSNRAPDLEDLSVKQVVFGCKEPW